jgi:hypothetical protein
MTTGVGVMGYNPALFARNPDGGMQLVPDQGPALVAGVGALPVPAAIPAQGGKGAQRLIPLPKMAMLSDNAQIIRNGFDLAPIMSPGYGLAQYTARFTSRPYEIITDRQLPILAAQDNVEWELHRWVERAGAPAIQAIPRPRYSLDQAGKQTDNLIWLEGPNPGSTNGLEQAGQILLHTEELRYTHHAVPTLPQAAWDLCEGTMNSAVFDGLFGPIRDPNTLLCQAPKWERYRFPNGRVFFKIVYTFLYRKDGWDKLPNGIDGKFYRVGYKNGGSLYNASDHNLLFRAAAPPPNGFQMGVI